MTVDEIADILYRYLKNHNCPVCDGKLRVEVHKKTAKSRKEPDKDPVIRHTFRVVCRGTCGGFVEGDDFGRYLSKKRNFPRDFPQDPIIWRGVAETLREKLKNTDRTIGDEVAKRLMEA